MSIRNLTHLAVAAILLASASNAATANAEESGFRVLPGPGINAGRNTIQINPRFEYKRPGRSGGYMQPNVLISPLSARFRSAKVGYISRNGRTEIYTFGNGRTSGFGILRRF